MNKDNSLGEDASDVRTTAHPLELLALRCEREEPTYTLDCAIAEATGKMQFQQISRVWTAPRLISSLDAAVTLVPGAHEWLRKSPDVMTVYAVPGDDKAWAKHIECAGKTPALALCAAALRARAALNEKETST